jgi:hypothetical protein
MWFTNNNTMYFFPGSCFANIFSLFEYLYHTYIAYIFDSIGVKRAFVDWVSNGVAVWL